jgi:hypothetical protein
MSTRPSKSDPYCGFKDDTLRYRALRVRCICGAVVAIAALLVVGFGPTGAAAAGSAAVVLRGWFSTM